MNNPFALGSETPKAPVPKNPFSVIQDEPEPIPEPDAEPEYDMDFDDGEAIELGDPDVPAPAVPEKPKSKSKSKATYMIARCEPEALEGLKEIAKFFGLSVSEIIVDAVATWVETKKRLVQEQMESAKHDGE